MKQAHLLLVTCLACVSLEAQPMKDPLAKYETVRLTADLTALTPKERAMIPLLIEAAQQMDRIFWMEAWGSREALMQRIDARSWQRFAEINYGPWDRLANNEPFLKGIGPKPAGANFYPHDMTKEEFQDHCRTHPEDAEAFRGLYSVIRRNEAGELVAVPYSLWYREPNQRAAEALRAAAGLAEDAGLKRYLTLRAEALLTDAYQASDMAWMDMKTNALDLVIGPIETYEDGLFGYKAAHEAYVLIKNKEWSQRLAKYATLLPALQRGLPVPDAYKQENPGTDSELNAYDVVYYAGDCNAGSKTIAINLPNDPKVQLEKGSRRLQLENSMRAKFDRILLPIADVLIAPEQREYITFDAFFGNTMFHEVAHGLGIKETINGNGPVRTALRDQSAALEEGKADILGLYMVTQLFESGELTKGRLEDHYVTFLAGIFRSVRFGAASAHGRANMVRFNYFAKEGAFTRDEQGRYRVDFAKMRAAMTSLSALILKLQGDGDYAGVMDLMRAMGKIGPELQGDLDRLQSIPVDVVFEQGMAVLEGK
ncbi:MAG: Zn-dependent hydrolase [Planctomycetes bacterium]|nr:Zn-dependent hydrolase [Planctomycetota bacterium]